MKSTTIMKRMLITVIAGMICSLQVVGQSERAEIRGKIVDLHGAIISGARVVLTDEQNKVKESAADKSGNFQFLGLKGGRYTIKIIAEGFEILEESALLRDGEVADQSYKLQPPSINESVTLKVDTDTMSLDPEAALGAQVLKERELAHLPNDTDQLAQYLQLMAVSSGGALGQAEISVDGMKGRLPPKSAIREVRINTNLYSAEYDKAPYRGGRIEVVTKGSSQSLHGSAFFNFNNSALNARDAFAPSKTPATTTWLGFQLGGPITRNKSGYLLNFENRSIDEIAVVNAVVLGDDNRPTAFAAGIPNPKRLIIGSARLDMQLGAYDTAAVRYDFHYDGAKNQGVGGFNLLERGYSNGETDHSFRLSGTKTLGTKAVSDLYLGLTLRRLEQVPTSTAAAISAPGAFVSGGASILTRSHNAEHLEAGNNLSLILGNHGLKFGVRLSGKYIRENRADNHNGTFVFGGTIAPEIDAAGEIVSGPDGPSFINISGLEQYRRTLLNLPGGGPTRFSLGLGDAEVAVNQWTFAAFLQDEWKLRPNLLLSLGIRYEGQTSPSDLISAAPRFGVAYSPDKNQRWILRLRSGIFYDRMNEILPLEARRFDGINRRQLILNRPSFPDPFSDAIENFVSTRRVLDPELAPPLSFQTQLGFERALRQGWKLQVSWSWSRGLGALRSRNINAPLTTLDADPLLSTRPFGDVGDILQFESSGRVKGTVLFVGANQTLNKHFILHSGYLLFDFRADTDGPSTLPQSGYNLQGEWARPSWQARHRGFIVGIVNLPWKLRATSIINANSGTPFNITTGRDNNNDGNFNDRPNTAPGLHSGVIATRFGLLDPNVVNGNLSRNAGSNPATMTLDLTFSRSFVITKTNRGEEGHALSISVRAGNLFNHTNVLGLNGVLLSPFFDRANNASAARRIELGLNYKF